MTPSRGPAGLNVLSVPYDGGNGPVPVSVTVTYYDAAGRIIGPRPDPVEHEVDTPHVIGPAGVTHPAGGSCPVPAVTQQTPDESRRCVRGARNTAVLLAVGVGATDGGSRPRCRRHSSTGWRPSARPSCRRVRSGQAITYATNQWAALTRYTTDGDLAIDNNAAERALRGVAVGRKNWLFWGSDRGGTTAAVLTSLVATCKRHGIDPWAYLSDVLARIPSYSLDRVSDFLPDAWAVARRSAT